MVVSTAQIGKSSQQVPARITSRYVVRFDSNRILTRQQLRHSQLSLSLSLYINPRENVRIKPKVLPWAQKYLFNIQYGVWK